MLNSKSIYRGLVAALSISFWLTAQAAVKPNQMAPDFALPSSNGETISLSDYKGKYVILEWTNHDCPFVKKHYSGGNMQGLQKQYTGQDVVWLSIISSAPGKQGYVDATAANMLTTSREAAPTHVLFDGDGQVGKTYGAKTTPHMYIIKPDGMLAYIGAIDSIKSTDPADIARATNYVTQAMNELEAGQAVSKPLTKPYGCSVKY
ncbi:thioredoxin family protein [Neiella marina]|uniref:Thioredoxin family protein n=1 Tax=Neiella holothuriorum TaxID=2870530 RepID=A0ABS7EEK2_9GAMM|nr:thioredoxin family protein [Neiella holothuriorum]MBW8190117.1 thioredoxin family protein [Neiella holothuriorum]